jgi:hypothetical protein
MSPRYFSKFTNTPSAESAWYHFTGENFQPGDPEYKMYVKFKIFKYRLKKIFRFK